MILLLSLLAAVAVALVLGGKLRNLPHLRLRYGWLMIVALLVQSYAIYFPAEKGAIQFAAAGIVLVCSYGLLLVAVWRNGHLPGMKMVCAGLLLNLAVIVANGGYMPMSPGALVESGLQKLNPGLELGARISQSKDVLLLPEDTRLWFLSDIFVVSGPWPLRSVFSLGDVLIALGAFVLVQTGTGVNLRIRQVLPARLRPTRP